MTIPQEIIKFKVRIGSEFHETFVLLQEKTKKETLSQMKRLRNATLAKQCDTGIRGSIIWGRTFRKPPFFVPSKPQTAFVFFQKLTPPYKGYRMVPYNLKVLAKFDLCSNCSRKLDECSLARARKIFASARMLGFSFKFPAV